MNTNNSPSTLSIGEGLLSPVKAGNTKNTNIDIE